MKYLLRFSWIGLIILSIFFFMLAGWILSSPKEIGPIAQLSLYVGLALVLLGAFYINSISKANQEILKQNYHLATTLAYLIEAEELLDVVTTELGKYPSHILERVVRLLSPQKKEVLIRYLFKTIDVYERWLENNLEPDGTTSEPEGEENWLVTREKLQGLNRLLEILKA